MCWWKMFFLNLEEDSFFSVLLNDCENLDITLLSVPLNHLSIKYGNNNIHLICLCPMN